MQTVRLARLILLFAAMRLVLAWVLGLGVDESYEVVLARVPSLSYFDHPPLSFWIAGATARLTGTEHRVVLRLPFISLFALTTWLLFRLTARMYGERAGYIVALLLNVSLVFGTSTGGWILPDGPLDCAMVATALCLSHVVLDPPGSKWRWWLAAGATTGIALLSKYHGVFLIAGTLLFVVTQRDMRVWLRRPQPYAAVALAIVMTLPVIIWNARHDWASLRFQGGRAASHGVHPVALLQNVGGQIGLVLPWIAVPLLWQLARGLRVGPRDTGRWLLTCLALWPIAVFTLVSLGGNPGLPHWPAPGYLFLFPLLGETLARHERSGVREQLLVRRFLTGTIAVFVVLVTVAASAVTTGWPTRVAPSLFRRGDPTLEAVDWRDLLPALRQRGLLATPRDDVVVTAHWIDGAKTGYALGPTYEVLCLSDDPRGFRFAYPPRDAIGRDVLLVVRAERAPSVAAKYGSYFDDVVPLGTVPITRDGQAVLQLAVFRARVAR